MEGKSPAAKSKPPVEASGFTRAMSRPAADPEIAFLGLQGSAGNQAVQAILQRSAATGAEAEAPAPESAPAPAAPTPEPTPEGPAPEASPAAALILEDTAETVGPGQMKKSEFFSRLHTEVCAAAEAGLAGTEHSAQGCPLIEFWIGYYERQDAERINRDLPRFAGEGPRPTTAEGYVALITARVRESVTTWARTGEVTGVPPGLPLPGMGLPALGGLGGVLGGLGGLAGLGPGRPLDTTLRSRMESAFGRGFSAVRVHTDGEAGRLSSRLSARAFTVGRHVAFAPGEYHPGTLIGDALIAHELAHVTQQGDAPLGPLPSGGAASYDSLEQDADLAAVGAVASLLGGLRSRVRSLPKAAPQLRSGLRLQRCPSCGTSTPQRRTTPPAPTRPAPRAAPAPSGACQPTPDTYAAIQRETTPGTMGYTKLDPGSEMICAPRFTPGPTPGTCSFTPRPLGIGFISKYTRKGDYPGGTRQVPGCPNPVPVVYRVTEAVEREIIQGEQEHCGDLQVAFDRTLRPCGAALQRLAGTPLAGQNDNECFGDLIRKLGFNPLDCTEEFLRLAETTQQRDDQDWHTFVETRIGGDCNQVILGFTRDPSNRIGDAAVAPDKHVPAATGCSGPAAAPAAPQTPPTQTPPVQTPPVQTPPVQTPPPGGHTVAKCSCQEDDDENR